ncbi:MAG: ABC transporter permease [Rhodospirillales bacterium]|jgi:putative spermidine/putrescine transport system permease protein|nr:ABC transporter permease [Rhodospirillales bacterium]MBT4041151.1 ABC transporter permease [Rhodospirillales bacterium]MBT4627197.1 ABC transporter permease [Rhodospirillales bacterium]MBT5353380.1 ABC transporter permease [Rhodospirillales bacterium]MBT5522394.1 ABC transporter permease [Rhodospirillales bacterium]
MTTATSEQILTADGTPLKDSLRKSLVRSKIQASLLVLPAFAFLMIMFIIPIGQLMTRSIDDKLVNEFLPRTFELFDQWDQSDLPGEDLYEAMFLDVTTADKTLLGRATIRMNYEVSGWRSLVKKSKREFKKIDSGPYKEAMIKAHKRWGEIKYWQSLGAMADNYTLGYYLNSFDLRFDGNKDIISQPENRQVYNLLWWRTFVVSMMVTFFCVLLGYPVAYLLATLPLRISNLLMICVLMPFWTSLLVRIVAWMIMLQQEGVVNNFFVLIGLVSDENRLAMMYNFTGTIIVMTQILLPFMILPMYSVMKGISPNYMKAAQNLGAAPSLAFIRVYIPQSLPGVGAGVILVFIVAIGYYITPELVGGKDGRLIGNMVAYHMQTSLNWGLASAMGLILLTGILVLYWLYDKLTGSAGMKMG